MVLLILEESLVIQSDSSVYGTSITSLFHVYLIARRGDIIRARISLLRRLQLYRMFCKTSSAAKLQRNGIENSNRITLMTAKTGQLPKLVLVYNVTTLFVPIHTLAHIQNGSISVHRNKMGICGFGNAGSHEHQTVAQGILANGRLREDSKLRGSLTFVRYDRALTVFGSTLTFKDCFNVTG